MGSPGCTAGAHNISISSRESLLGRSQLMVRTAVWLAGWLAGQASAHARAEFLPVREGNTQLQETGPDSIGGSSSSLGER